MTDAATSQVPMSGPLLVLYQSCARCRLVWATDFAGTAINGPRRRDDRQEVTVRPRSDRRLTPRDQQLD
jgi:hypothetical protein